MRSHFLRREVHGARVWPSVYYFFKKLEAMPAYNTDAISQQTRADIAAFLLKQNGYQGYCLAECAPGPLDVKCLQCMCGDNYPSAFNCYDPYNTCSGLNLPYCKQLDAGAFDGFPPPNDAGACD